MSQSEAWDELGPHEVDPKLGQRIKRKVELESRVTGVILNNALKILEFRDSAVMNPRYRAFDKRSEKIMTLRLIHGVGYPINSDYGKMDDPQLGNYLSEIVAEIHSLRR